LSLGLAWLLVVPLAQMLLFYVIFRSGACHQHPQLLCVRILWLTRLGWFRSSLVAARDAITENRELLRDPGFPLAVLPVLPLITQLVHFLRAVPILFVAIALAGAPLLSALLAYEQ
jgi:lipopolysaccharide transport system permease protein